MPKAEAAPTTTTSTAAASTTSRRRPPRTRMRVPCSPPVASSSARASRAEARRCASALGAATPRRKLRKRSSSTIQINSCCRERRNVRFCRFEFTLCGRARPVEPRADRSDRDVECKSDLLVAEVCEGIEEQRIALARAHRRKSTRQPSIERRAIDSCIRLVLVGDPPVDSAAAVGVQLTALGPPLAMEQVRRDPVQPRQDAPTRTAALPPREGQGERLCRQLVGEITSSAAMQVPVHGSEVPIEDQLKRCRLMQRTSQAVRIRRSGVHTLTVPEARLRVSTTGTRVTDAVPRAPEAAARGCPPARPLLRRAGVTEVRTRRDPLARAVHDGRCTW